MEEFDVTGCLPILVWAYLELGEPTQATETVAAAIRGARAGQLRLILVNALRVRALVAVRQGRSAEAVPALEEGLALTRAMPYPYAEGRLLRVYVEMHILKGGRERARECLEEALAIFRRLGASRDSERIERMLTALS